MGKTDRKALQSELARLRGLEESLHQHQIDPAKTGRISIFGYGSLPSNPHWPPSSVTAAFLSGWRRRFCCACSGRGTQEFPGLTLGLEQDQNAVVPGSVLHYGGLSVARLADMLHVFADREVPDMPIYRFGLARTETADGKTLLAVACFADCESPYYRTGLSLTEKSQIIAMACGALGTCKDYLDRYVRRHVVKTGFDGHPSPRRDALLSDRDYFTALLQAVDQRRAEMRLTMPDYLAALEAREKDICLPQSDDKSAALV